VWGTACRTLPSDKLEDIIEPFPGLPVENSRLPDADAADKGPMSIRIGPQKPTPRPAQ
jgi:hypothetical protein